MIIPATGSLPDLHPKHDPRNDWPTEAKSLKDTLTDIYGDGDPLPTAAGAWIARQKSRHTRRAYVRAFLRWEEYARNAGIHPLKARLSLADAYNNYLITAPTLQRVKGGSSGETSPTGPPLSDSSRAQALAACGSFYRYTQQIELCDRDPFRGVVRPYIDPDFSPTEGVTKEETASLLKTAREWSKRSFALVCLLYFLGLRIDQVLSLNIEDFGYDRGYLTITLRKKGGGMERNPLPPIVVDAVFSYIGDRKTGPLFITSSGRRWTQNQVWKHLKVLAKKSEITKISRVKPHLFRHEFGTDALEDGAPLHKVQDAMGHKSSRTTQRYNRRRKRLEDHPTHMLSLNMSQRLDEED